MEKQPKDSGTQSQSDPHSTLGSKGSYGAPRNTPNQQGRPQGTGQRGLAQSDEEKGGEPEGQQSSVNTGRVAQPGREGSEGSRDESG